MTPVACPLCRGTRTYVLVPGLVDRYPPHGRHRILRCGGCGISFTDPPGRAVPEGYESHRVRDYPERRKGTRGAILRVFYRNEGTAAEKLGLCLPYLLFRARDWMKVRQRGIYTRPFWRRGRLLDVGCGTGESMLSWRGQQAECVGLEPDPDVARKARELTGMDVRSGALEAQEFPAESFDVITMSHVLEHVEDPRSTLRAAARLLRPGGELLIWVPDFGSPLRGLFGAGWFPYEVPRHRWHYRVEDVARLLREAGLRPRELVPDVGESTFRRSAREAVGLLAPLLRRRACRLIAMGLCRLFRRSDVFRMRAVK